jgi:hypothetical protein
MDSDDQGTRSTSTRNSRLLPRTFQPSLKRHGKRQVPEPHGPQRRPKSGDFKLLAAYVAAYINNPIPQEEYNRFITRDGERTGKRLIRVACDIAWKAGDEREFDDFYVQQYKSMVESVASTWLFAAKYFDGA